MNSLEEVSRDEFSQFIRKHKNLESKPYESSTVCSMMYVDENMGGMTIAQAIYYKSGKPVYKIRKDYKQSEDNNMHENIENRIIELKEIALQIINHIENNNGGMLPYAMTKLLSLTQGKVADEIKRSGMQTAYAYTSWIIRLLADLQHWRGNDARQYKAMLREYLAYFEGKLSEDKLREKTATIWQNIKL